MNGVHDLGGMDNFGPIDIEQDEPIFHQDWERDIFGLTISTLASGYFKIDEVRRKTEEMPPVDYLKASYYEKWVFTLESIMVEKDVLTWEEIKAGKSLREEGVRLPPVPKEAIQHAMTNPVPVRIDADIPAKFKVGDHIITKNMNPKNHTRLPRYTRGKRGVIEQHHGIFVLPDANAHGGVEKPEHNYTVKFSAAELWGDENPPKDFVYIDLFDSYMEPA